MRRVAQVGRDGLTPEEKRECPPLQSGNRAHGEAIRKVFSHHAHGAAKSFERFYQAQLVWDESMARKVTDALEGDRPVVVLAGEGHVAHSMGIPERVASEGPLKARIVIPVAHGEMPREAMHIDHLVYPQRKGDLFWEATLEAPKRSRH